MKSIIDKPRYKIEQLRIDDWQGVQRWRLDRFAAEFGHKIEPVFPIFIVFVDGALVCFYYAQPQVVIYPAVHPDLVTPRMFYECAKVLVAATKQAFGNPLWLIDIGAPGDQGDNAKKIGLIRQSVHVFEVGD